MLKEGDITYSALLLSVGVNSNIYYIKGWLYAKAGYSRLCIETEIEKRGEVYKPYIPLYIIK